MSNRNKSKAPPKAGGNVISLDALLGNWPVIELAGIRFDGRHLSQTEKAAWLSVEAADDAVAQRQFLLEAVNARGANATQEWVDSQPDVYLVAIVRGLLGAGWPGETPK